MSGDLCAKVSATRLTMLRPVTQVSDHSVTDTETKDRREARRQ